MIGKKLEQVKPLALDKIAPGKGIETLGWQSRPGRPVKVALVTGAGSSIGSAIALAMAANGTSVLVIDLEGHEVYTVAEGSQLGAPRGSLQRT